MSTRTPAAPSSLLPDALIFLIGGALVYTVTRRGVPRLAATGIDPFAAWMLLSVPFVFAPIVGMAWWLLRSETPLQPWRERLRLRRMSGRDGRGAALGLAAILVASALLSRLCTALGLSPDPFAREPRAWTGERAWMFVVWAVYGPINILGEELVWRGVILPRMEARLGHRA